MKILVADDHQIVRYGLKLVLKGIYTKATILEASDLNTAINLISANEINLIVFDVNMPGADKLEELIRFIIKEMRVVIFSGYDRTNQRIEGLLEAGADVFIFKDASVSEIKDVFSSLDIADKNEIE